MKTTEKILAEIKKTEEKLSRLRANLRDSQKADAASERDKIYLKMKAAGLSLDDIEVFISSRAGITTTTTEGEVHE